MTTANNKAMVLAAVKQLIGERNPQAVDTYVHDDYIQHSPQVKGGKAGLKAALEQLRQLPAPGRQESPIVMVIAEDDYVLLLMQLTFMGKRLAIADLYRVVDGKLAEHWDATQEQAITMVIPGVEELGVPAVNKAIVREFFRSADGALVAPGYGGPLDFGGHTLHRMVAEGALVMVQSSCNGAVFYDIFRLKDQLLASHWRVSQVIPAVMPHENGMV
ncbi:SnoaL-like domain-containing protein [Chitinophaga polysaccharea]|uniref:nuclear transport factor 2 family protein n=1 Tax=Chitinophaga TaxID=79328 RepID=UPI0014556ED9|nr:MULTISPECIES: nuclear transport factor 2 family protein [Chitinophaga]NLR59308.1 SnoaL-like domain-containing protein [Chitinophaga polysaccharea]NLU91924.1 SnoaL-like domain-containing protein [Chitinophaga sp. Ak27]